MLSELYDNSLGSPGRLGPRRFDRLIPRQRHAHAALAIDFWLTKQTQRRIRLAQGGAEVGECGLG